LSYRWQVLVALVTVGFEQTALFLLPDKPESNPALPRELERQIRKRILSKTSKSPGVILVRLPNASLAANWRPNPSWSCFALRAGDIDDAPKLGIADYVLIEFDKKPEEEVSTNEITRVTKALQSRELYDPSRTRVGIFAAHAVTAAREYP